MKKLLRSKVDRKLAGVCAGIAKYIGMDATVIRVLCIIAAILSAGVAILAYIACALIIPEENNIIESK